MSVADVSTVSMHAEILSISDEESSSQLDCGD